MSKKESEKALANSLRDYFLKKGRLLPWRADRDPYHVHLSEIMLQQTRVEAVIPYYERFLSRFPSVQELANADEGEVMKLWEGLGYYSRARNLLSAAKCVVERFGGAYPQTKKELLLLPGVGDYTASAIASICFEEQTVPVDGNFLRIHARLTASTDDISLPSTKERCKAFFSSLYPEIEPAILSQSVMELGQRICIPNGKPLCGDCPLKEHCKAYQTGTPERYPTAIKKKAKKEEFFSVLVFEKEGKIGYELRPEKGLLASLYAFPMAKGYLSEEELDQEAKGFADSYDDSVYLGEFEHVFTHKIWKMKAYLFKGVSGDSATLRYLSFKEREEGFALPSAFMKIEESAKNHL